MTFARLLAGVLLVCSAPALFAQNQPSLPNLAEGKLAPDAAPRTWFAPCCVVTMPAEPWRIIPKPPSANAQSNPTYRLLSHDNKAFRLNNEDLVAGFLKPNLNPGMLDSTLESRPDADTMCLSIRSYVVARDSKDSDSTHLVSYSTCQPTNRYQLKSTEIRVDSDR